MSKLVLFLPEGGSRDIKLDRERLSIGRRPDNDVCLLHPAVSGEHAAVVTILADSFLEDLGSTNGTLVNGRAITKHLLHDRDEIDIGRQLFVYVVDEAATIEVPPASKTPAEGLSPGQRAAREPTTANRPPTGAAASATRSPAAAHDGRNAPPGETAGAPSTASVAAEPAVLTLRVLTGASAGRTLPLTKPETLVGRVGVQVAALRITPDGMLLFPVEGSRGATVNGATVDAAGLPVKAGDVIEVAGAQLELIATAGEPTSAAAAATG